MGYMGDLMTDKWIEIEIGLNAYASSLLQTREYLKKWAQELGWEYNEKKKVLEQNDSPVYPLSIAPKGGKISPSEFEEDSDKILAISEQIADLLGNVDEQGIPFYNNTFFFVNLMRVGKKEAVEMLMHRYHVLILKYPFYRRLELEKRNSELSITIFGDTVEKDISLMQNLKIKISEHIFNKDAKLRKKRVHDRLLNWFNIKIV